MNKLMKTLLCAILCVLVAAPATVIAGLSSDEDYRILTETEFTNSLETDNIDLQVPISSSTGSVEYTLFINGNDFGEVTIPAETHSAYTFMTLNVGNLYTRLSENQADEITVEIALDIDGNYGTAVDQIDLGDIIVSIRQPVEEDDELMPGLITEIDLREDELTFGDVVEFDVGLENDDEENPIENAYFEVALFDAGGDKVEGWIDSSSDNIRLDEEDGEVTCDNEDVETELVIPSSDDLDIDDVEILTIRVRVFGDYIGQHEHLLDIFEETIEVEKLDDHLSIDAITFEQQGNVLYTAITVENDGEENQQDVRARVQVTELDVKQTSNKVTVYEDDDATLYVPVVLPTFTTGDYDIRITVYNDEVSVSETVEDVELTGIVAPTGDGVVIGVDTSVKTVSANGAVYAMTFTNQGVAARTFTLETAGAEWAQTSVNPATVVVDGGSSEIASVFVAPNAGEQGMRQFTVFIKEGAQIVKTISLTANVEGGDAVTGGAVLDFDDLVSSGLKWVAAILVVVLIVLFVMWSWRRSEEEEL